MSEPVVFHTLNLMAGESPDGRLPRRIVIELVRHEEREIPSADPAEKPKKIFTSEVVDTGAYVPEPIR